ncbi:MAG: TetR family transcriptional regulator C-terminal domain-containing protein [Sneathiella sp.]|nr:TetR family transcriptional regulator C-terminal domain-containing protein [Sneathiella sp.]
MRGKNREKILEAGYDLFYQNGFEATGVQEIANASSVPKGSFYNYFSSKTNFAVEVIELYADRQTAYLQENLLQGDASPLTRLKDLFEDWEEQFFKVGAAGCLAGNLSQELANHEEPIRIALHSALCRLEGFFVTIVRQAQQAGEIPIDIGAEETGAFLYNGWQGAILRAKVTQNTDPMRHFINLVFTKVLK